MGYIRASPAGAVTTTQAKLLLSNIDHDVDELLALLSSLKRKKTPQR
jgi:predicted transcriptional regulator